MQLCHLARQGTNQDAFEACRSTVITIRPQDDGGLAQLPPVLTFEFGSDEKAEHTSCSSRLHRPNGKRCAKVSRTISLPQHPPDVPMDIGAIDTHGKCRGTDRSKAKSNLDAKALARARLPGQTLIKTRDNNNARLLRH